jgi:high-affinity nickel-transport protein
MDATTPLVAALGYGFVLGLRHSLDPDHLVAMGTIVGESRSVRRSAIVGAMWGVGHTVSLLLAGVLVLGLRLTVPEALAQGLELGVAAMLVTLGTVLVFRAARGEVHAHAHAHEDGTVHAHLHAHPERPAAAHAAAIHHHPHGLRGFVSALFGGSGSRLGEIGRKPFWVGIVHGLAGSAGLMLLGLAATPTFLGGIAYLSLFGAGLGAGMLGMGALLSIPFVLSSGRLVRFNAASRVAAGLASVAFGLHLAWEIAFVDGLLG